MDCIIPMLENDCDGCLINALREGGLVGLVVGFDVGNW